ncbi:MAG: NUDIX domain-containing protein [Butyrivibrio sp.]|uniref:NUDIX hydrolase n=1 Tax=Butyrivibrio sp. TaxID=28121 RepID=UPI0025E78208|nr:NUDIX domain-containing protein [Butyrivibrio sp.]MCR5770091.1 NUDIX domain-containing protein [Butyrivibrio sp.]
MEILDIVDENGNPTGETVERNKAHSEGIRHRTSHVWLVRKAKDKITGEDVVEVLLQKRSANKDSHPGEWDISSAGHIPSGCEFRESAIRELKEELGISVKESELVEAGILNIGSDNVFHGKPFHDRQVSKVFVLEKDLPVSEFTVQESELSEVRWFEINKLIEDTKEGRMGTCLRAEELTMVKNTFRI